MAVAQREELEGPTTRIYNYVLGLWGGKKRGRMVTDVSSGPILKKKITLILQLSMRLKEGMEEI